MARAVALQLALGALAAHAQPPGVGAPPAARPREERFRGARLRPRPLALTQRWERPAAEVESYKVKMLKKIPHVGKPWTQGLEFSDTNELIETSGDYPPGSGSFIRVVDTETGEPREKITDGLAPDVFIEGISELGGKWYASTYMNHEVLEYDKDFSLMRTLPYPWQGWGLARNLDGISFLATNSSKYLITLDPENFELQGMKEVTCRGRPVPGLNELETVDDFMGKGPRLLGNLINTRIVMVLDPATATCTGAFHLNDLEPVSSEERFGRHVANGIAYNKGTGTFWVTGKNWDSMFEIALAEDANEQQAMSMLEMHLMAYS